MSAKRMVVPATTPAHTKKPEEGEQVVKIPLPVHKLCDDIAHFYRQPIKVFVTNCVKEKIESLRKQDELLNKYLNRPKPARLKPEQ